MRVWDIHILRCSDVSYQLKTNKQNRTFRLSQSCKNVETLKQLCDKKRNSVTSGNSMKILGDQALRVFEVVYQRPRGELTLAEYF